MNGAAELRRLQQRFQDYVLTGRPDIEEAIASSDAASAAERLAVYAKAYRLRLLEVLANDFPALQAFVNAAEFEQIGREYIDAHPSDTPSVRWFGRHLPEFLRTAQSDQPLLAELAQFEWLRGEAFDAPDADCVSVEQIAALPADAWPGLRLTLHPAVRRLQLNWNAPAICKALLARTDAPPAERSAAAWLLWRHDLNVHWRSQDEVEAVALDAVAAGVTFAEVCEVLLPQIPANQAAFHAASLLKRWVVDGLVSGIRLGY